LDFFGAVDPTGRGLEQQLRSRFEEVSGSLPKEVADKIYDDLNAIAVQRNLAETSPVAAQLYAELAQQAMAKWQATLSRSYQQAVAERQPWYKNQTNWFVIAGGVVALVLLVVLTRKKGT